jgi:hypothetical protein
MHSADEHAIREHPECELAKSEKRRTNEMQAASEKTNFSKHLLSLPLLIALLLVAGGAAGAQEEPKRGSLPDAPEAKQSETSVKHKVQKRAAENFRNTKTKIVVFSRPCHKRRTVEQRAKTRACR